MIRVSLLHPDRIAKWMTPEEFAARVPVPSRRLAKFLARVNFRGPLPRGRRRVLGRCWVWTGHRNRTLYGVYGLYICETKKWRNVSVHVLALRTVGQELLKGMHTDHLCRVRHCLRPSHLQVVTPRVNSMRGTTTLIAIARAKTRCPQGHALKPGNLAPWQLTRGKRCCLTCIRAGYREAKRRYRERLKRRDVPRRK